EVSGKAALKKGYHKIKVIYYDSGGGNVLKILFNAEGKDKVELPGSMLFH
ncbi:MAG: hypothetical protein IT255_01035, partial [Chitinophagaceae bacterium]|nr:hypothetical protein [Chitinophagaceae bacterium]